MSNTVIIRHRVADFDTWRAGYDQHAAARAAHGLSGESIHRDLDDASMVTVLATASDVDKVRAFFADPGLREAMGKAGVVSQPDLWLTADA